MNRFLTIYVFLLLCGTASAQQIIEWNNLQTITDNARRTVYYEKGSKQPLQGEYRIIRGLDEERVKFSDGIINGDYFRYRDGVLRESGIYAKGKRNGTFTEYYQDGVTLRKETPMQQGKINGTVKTYFRNGKIETEKEYRQSVESGRERRFDISNTVLVALCFFITNIFIRKNIKYIPDNEAIIQLFCREIIPKIMFINILRCSIGAWLSYEISVTVCH